MSTPETDVLYQAIAKADLSPAWIEVIRWRSFGVEGVTAVAYSHPRKSSPGVCRGESNQFGLDGKSWVRVGDESNYVILSHKELAYCSSKEAAQERIVIVGELPDGEIQAVVASIRAGRKRSEIPPQTLTLPDGSVSVIPPVDTIYCDTDAKIGSIRVDSLDSVVVATSRRPGAGQHVRLTKLGGVWLIVEATEWIA